MDRLLCPLKAAFQSGLRSISYTLRISLDSIAEILCVGSLAES
jgi:hypothetical protein